MLSPRFSLGLAFSLTLLACGSSGSADGGARTATVAALEGNATAGASVYAAECTRCHGADGKSGSEKKNVASDAAGDKTKAVDQVINGGGGMPAFPSLSDQEIADVVAHLASLK